MRALLRRYCGPLGLSDGPAADAVRLPLERYFAGELAALCGNPLCASGGTEFQRSVWNALTRIPAGETLSYGRLAARLGKPAAGPRGRPCQRRQSGQRRRALPSRQSGPTAR